MPKKSKISKPHVSRVFVIAEAGVNHNGSLKAAKQLVVAAAKAGADAIKFQTFQTASLATRSARQAEYQKTNLGKITSQAEMLRKLEMTASMHFELEKLARKTGIEFSSTAFDDASLDFLTDHFKLRFLKIPSGEITNAPFLLKIARKQLPVILSTGMSTIEEVRKALGVLAYGYLNRSNKNPGAHAFSAAYRSRKGQTVLKKRVTVLHCVTQYPAPFEQTNLRVIPALSKELGLKVGFSDHSRGIFAPIAAVALGAVVIEKHLTLSRSMKGPDHRASIEPEEFKQMVEGIRQTEQMLGNAIKRPQNCELKNIAVARKRIVARTPIKKGDIFSESNLTTKRSVQGASPMDFWVLCGRKALRQYAQDEGVICK